MVLHERELRERDKERGGRESKVTRRLSKGHRGCWMAKTQPAEAMDTEQGWQLPLFADFLKNPIH